MPNAIIDFASVNIHVVSYGSHKLLFMVCHAAYLLSGALKAACYGYWTLSGANSKRHSANVRLSNTESFLMSAYFDLGSFNDAEIYENKRVVAETIANLRGHMASLP